MSGDDDDFAKMFAAYESATPAKERKRPRVGDLVKGTIISVGKDAVFVDIGGKAEGSLDRAQVEDREGKMLVALTFGAMALSTFIFDTIDSATRLGRYILQELIGSRSRVSAMLATLLTCAVPLLFLLTTKPGSYRDFWTLFGSSNQLLAALSLLAVTIWMRRQGRRTWYTFYPMLGVMAVTVTSLVLQTRQLWETPVGSAKWINGLVSVLLLILATIMVVDAYRARGEKLKQAAGAELPKAKVV